MFPPRAQPRNNMRADQSVSNGAISTPTSPREMIQKDSQLTKVASTVLYPRLVLLGALTKFKDEPKQRAKSGGEICEARRDFLDSFAYLCDVEKGGKTVTATGLQRLEKDNHLWLAANEGIRGDILIYANTILDRIKLATEETRHTVRADVLALSVEKCRLRIQFYKIAVQEHARNCRMALRKVERNEIGMSAEAIAGTGTYLESGSPANQVEETI